MRRVHKKEKSTYIYVKASDVISVFTTRDWIPAISTTVKSTRLPAAPPFNRARKKLTETPLNVTSWFHPHIRTHPTDNRDSNENINFSRKSDPSSSLSLSLFPLPFLSRASEKRRDTVKTWPPEGRPSARARPPAATLDSGRATTS